MNVTSNRNKERTSIDKNLQPLQQIVQEQKNIENQGFMHRLTQSHLKGESFGNNNDSPVGNRLDFTLKGSRKS